MTKQQRAAVVTEAQEWVTLQTPYVPHAKLKGKGCDCATFILAVYSSLGLCPDIDLGNYSIQAHLHKPVNAEAAVEQKRYEEIILQYADEITEAESQPGDLVLWKVAHSYAHGGIVFQRSGPSLMVIHSMNRHGVIYSDANLDSFLKGRPRKFFRRNFLKG